MRLKSFIKNDLWRINYIYPFAKKHLSDEKGWVDMVGHILHVYRDIRRVKGENPRSVGGDGKALLSETDVIIPEKGFIYFIDEHRTLALPGSPYNNMTLDYEKLLAQGFHQRLNEVGWEDEYGRQIKLIVEGIENLISRILVALKESDHLEKEKRIAEFENMLDKPVQSFEEALQRILFFNQIMWQTRHRLNGIGHMDWLLDPYYQGDITSGKITEADADRMLDDFFNKLSRYASYKADALVGDIGQIIVLGGLKKDGTYCYSRLTEQIMCAQARARVPDPKIILRVSEKMPWELMNIAVKCLESATGSPMFANDDVILPLLMEFGYAKEDIYDYCFSACWEPFIIGKSFESNNMSTYDFSIAFDKLMDNLAGISSFKELVDRYTALNEESFISFLKQLDDWKWAREPLISFLTDGCNEKRKDITEGGAKYSNYGVTTVALGNVVDSLLNIRYLVFEEKKFTLEQMAEIRKNNFQGADDLLTFCKENRYYGRDVWDAIALSNSITDSLATIAIQYKTKFGGTVKFGLSSQGYNMASKKMAGDFSGRKLGDPYNTHISCMTAGYTEVVNFSGKLSYDRQRFNGNVDDFFISPDFLHKNRDKFVQFMMLAIRQGFFEMQMNVMDSRTLIDAKAHPERYPGLIVRVWGMSAYFNELPESYKDLLIRRAIAMEKAAN